MAVVLQPSTERPAGVHLVSRRYVDLMRLQSAYACRPATPAQHAPA